MSKKISHCYYFLDKPNQSYNCSQQVSAVSETVKNEFILSQLNKHVFQRRMNAGSNDHASFDHLCTYLN